MFWNKIWDMLGTTPTFDKEVAVHREKRQKRDVSKFLFRCQNEARFT